jgi:hypothetical protein
MLSNIMQLLLRLESYVSNRKQRMGLVYLPFGWLLTILKLVSLSALY